MTNQDDPMGDNDPLVVEALNNLFDAIGQDSQSKKVRAIDDLIQARIVLALETLTNAVEQGTDDDR